MALLDLVSFVKRGKNRKKIFSFLDKPMMPSELMRKIFGKTSNTYFNLVSRALCELKDEKLIEIVNPKNKTGRIYRKTKLGKSVEKKLKELE
ncbi:MAG: transcriptional regulator [Nanoarchaeota archaeon]|nr:transcriptional regulator [Nanoarchaeota archaeon]|tara:strand:- start:1195 stop:1470 length:276 start_codon:yes stop_codon:yes gene_type:complete